MGFLLGDFKDPVVQARENRHKAGTNDKIHWTNPQKVPKKECAVCGRSSSTVYECLQCHVNIHPQCMAAYHNW